MNLDNIIKLTKSKIITKSDNINDFNIEYAGASDLMSDFLAFSKENMFLITGLTSPQTITTAAVIGAKGIIFVRGKEINDNIIKIAKDLDITILKSNLSMYVACAILYNNGLKDSMGTDEGLK
jgi:predicted transcriptional regulator